MRAGSRKLTQTVLHRRQFRRGRIGPACQQIVRDKRQNPVMLNQFQIAPPVNLSRRTRSNQLTILRPLRPSGAQQEQVKLGRPARLRSRDLIQRIVLLLLQFTASWTLVLDDTLQPLTPRKPPRRIRRVCGIEGFQGNAFAKPSTPVSYRKHVFQGHSSQPRRRLFDQRN